MTFAVRSCSAASFTFAAFSACSYGTEIRLGGSYPASGGQGTGSAIEGDGGGASEPSGGAPGSSGGLAGAGPTVTIVASNVRPLTEINAEEKDDNPTLTWDELLLCFTSKRPTSSGGTDIWCSERSAFDEPFGEPIEQISLNTAGFESSPSIGADGLSIWFGAEGDEGIDIFVASRADWASSWGAPVRVSELNSAEDDLPRPLALEGRLMPLSSRRDSPAYWTYLAERTSVDQPFGAPRLIKELAVAGQSFVDAFLLEDGLTMLVTVVDEDGESDLHLATRASLSAPFSHFAPVEGVNTEAEERDPFLSADGQRLYFSSDREGELDLFVADISIEP